jgi:hypothetical protein
MVLMLSIIALAIRRNQDKQMSNYFTNFPLVDYPNAGQVLNIAARVAFNNIDQATVPYTMNHSLRPDQIADRYYNNENDDWSIYIANNIIDPYYQWYIDPEVLNQIIAKQYTSLDIAAQKIVFWRTNWRGDGALLTPLVYDSLPAIVKQYYNASTNGSGQVTSYQRKKATIFRKTNLIVRYALVSPPTFNVGDKVTLGTLTGTGVVTSINGLNVLVQDIIGTSAVTTINGITCTVIETHAPISAVETPYYEPVSAYDAAVALNDSRRSIKVVVPDQIGPLNKQLARVLS